MTCVKTCSTAYIIYIELEINYFSICMGETFAFGSYYFHEEEKKLLQTQQDDHNFSSLNTSQ